jgi:hypothetical protein
MKGRSCASVAQASSNVTPVWSAYTAQACRAASMTVRANGLIAAQLVNAHNAAKTNIILNRFMSSSVPYRNSMYAPPATTTATPPATITFLVVVSPSHQPLVSSSGPVTSLGVRIGGTRSVARRSRA